MTFATPMMMMTVIVSTLITAMALMNQNHTAVEAATRKAAHMDPNHTAVEAATRKAARMAINRSTVTVMTPILTTGMDLPAMRKPY